MADVKMPEHVPCAFNLGLDGKCGLPSDNERCSHHEGLKCVSCGKSAIRICCHLVTNPCSAPLCADCHHAEDDAHVPRLAPAGEGYPAARGTIEAASTP